MPQIRCLADHAVKRSSGGHRIETGRQINIKGLNIDPDPQTFVLTAHSDRRAGAGDGDHNIEITSRAGCGFMFQGTKDQDFRPIKKRRDTNLVF